VLTSISSAAYTFAAQSPQSGPAGTIWRRSRSRRGSPTRRRRAMSSASFTCSPTAPASNSIRGGGATQSSSRSL
jgi:hypothetical protein